MGCNKRGFGPDRLELSLSLPPSSRLACGVLTIDTTARPPELEAAFLGGSFSKLETQVQVPICKRAAIHFKLMVVSWPRRRASMTFDRCPLRRARSWYSSQPSRSISFLKCHSVLAQASPSVDTNFWRSWSSRKISSRWSPRFMTWYIAPGYSMRSLRDMGNPYQHVPEVSIVRTDTYLYDPTRSIAVCGNSPRSPSSPTGRPI